MDLDDQLKNQPGLSLCRKVPGNTFATLIGLHINNPDKPRYADKGRPVFRTKLGKEFYECTQVQIVDKAVERWSRQQVLQEMKKPDTAIFKKEVSDLLAEFGPRIWARDSDHLIDANSSDLYPVDLYYYNKEDREK